MGDFRRLQVQQMRAEAHDSGHLSEFPAIFHLITVVTT
jgi:hypothetical protein